MNKTNNNANIKKLCTMAMFCALAVAATLLTKWLQIAHLTFDAKDAVLTVAAYICGPFSAVLMSLVTSVIESLTFGGDTGWYGFLMNFLSSAVFAFIAAAIYNKKRDMNGAIIGLSLSTVLMTAIMLILNIFVAPLYFGLPLFAPFIMDMIPTLVLPFNLAKGLMNSALALYLYRPVLMALSKARLLGDKKVSLSFNKNTLMSIIAGAILLVASAVTFIVLYAVN